jgi:hypothetical protein
MSKVYLNSFATPDFWPYLKDMTKSARQYNLKNCLCYTLSDLQGTEFYKRNIVTFQHKTGFGFWLWKPFFVYTALKRLKEGDILFYVDAASLFINDPAPLIKLARENESGIVSFDGWPLTNGQWTKRDAFINANCDTEEYWSANKVIATVILFRKSDFTMRFCEEWLSECEKFSSISDVPNIHGMPNMPDFVAHRMDQSILAILVKKYQLETYRNPSKWGNFLKLEQFRVPGEHLTLSYLFDPKITDYSDKAYQNSPYGTIFEFNRKVNHPKRRKTVRTEIRGMLEKAKVIPIALRVYRALRNK